MSRTGIDLENIVYYKDNTHYFVMTAKKQSLLDKGVIINVSWGGLVGTGLTLLTVSYCEHEMPEFRKQLPGEDSGSLYTGGEPCV